MRFIADNTVGKLCRWMNMLGYDIDYDPRSSRELLGDPRVNESGRLILGRCPTIAQRSDLETRFFHLESENLSEQLAQVAKAFPLDFGKTIFSRCSHCNEGLEGPLSRDEVAGQIPPKVKEWRDVFFRCPRCGNVYWEGTHTERIRMRLKEWLGADMAG